jgi:hypothetical protein
MKPPMLENFWRWNMHTPDHDCDQWQASELQNYFFLQLFIDCAVICFSVTVYTIGLDNNNHCVQ